MKPIDLSSVKTPEEIEAAREEAKREILRRIPCTDYLRKAPKGGYICPYCGSGTGPNKTGAVKYYKESNTCACFACPEPGQMARKFDVLDCIQQELNCDYSEALKIGADRLFISLDGASAPRTQGTSAADKGQKTQSREEWEAANEKQQEALLRSFAAWKAGHTFTEKQLEWLNDTWNLDDFQSFEAFYSFYLLLEEDGKTPTARGAAAIANGYQRADYSAYYEKCKERLADPAALSYLQARGISEETAAAFNIGFDPQADPASAPGALGDEYKPHPTPRIIIPCTKGFYVARSIDKETPAAYKAMNPKGGNVQLFNSAALYSGAGVVFVVEGVFDCLSFIEADAAAVALCGKGNGDILKKQLQERPTTATLIICHDNDEDPKTAAQTMKQAQELNAGLHDLGFKSIIYNVAGDYHDANDAFINDPETFEDNVYKAAMEAADAADPAEEPLPGLLTYDNAVSFFETADDRILDLKSFPTFGATAKIKLHDSIVLAADTGAGKSSLAINFMNDLNGAYPCIYFNLEMDNIDVLRRLTAIQSGLELDTIEGYRRDAKTAEAVNTSLKAITSRKPLQVIQGAYLLPEIEDIIKQSTAGREDPTIVFIDHSLLVDTKKSTASRYDRFTQVSEGLRKMALTYNIILFVLLQQSRAGKAEEAEPPRNSSLKESGSWENDATQICFLWYDPTIKRKKLLLTKNRHGNPGEFILNYWKKTQTYTEAKTGGQASADPTPRKLSKRDKQQQKLEDAYRAAYTATGGQPTIKAMAEAADVTTSTIKSWIKEYGGCMVDGIHKDPAGIDEIVEYTGFIKLTPEDVEEEPEETPKSENIKRI